MGKIVRKMGYQIQFEISNKIFVNLKKKYRPFPVIFYRMANFKGNHLVTGAEIKFLFFNILQKYMTIQLINAANMNY